MAVVDTVTNLHFPYKVRRFLGYLKYLLVYEEVMLHGGIYM